MKRLDPWFVTGLAQGVGTFTFSRQKRSVGSLVFGVKLGVADRPVLAALADYFSVGALYDVKARAPRPSGSGATKAACFYKVARLGDLEAVVDHFHEYPLQGAKRAVFDVWEQMVALKVANFRRPPAEELDALAERLTRVTSGV
jgi:hypothetical protein